MTQKAPRSAAEETPPMSRRMLPWLNRIVLLVGTLLLAFIGLKFVTDPVEAAWTSGIALGSALAVTTMRASFGAFPLGGALFALFCLVTARRRVGLVFVATLIGTALVVRMLGAAADGTLAESLRLILVEAMLLAASLAALIAEARLARRPEPA